MPDEDFSNILRSLLPIGYNCFSIAKSLGFVEDQEEVAESGIYGDTEYQEVAEDRTKEVSDGEVPYKSRIEGLLEDIKKEYNSSKNEMFSRLVDIKKLKKRLGFDEHIIIRKLKITVSDDDRIFGLDRFFVGFYEIFAQGKLAFIDEYDGSSAHKTGLIDLFKSIREEFEKLKKLQGDVLKYEEGLKKELYGALQEIERLKKELEVLTEEREELIRVAGQEEKKKEEFSKLKSQIQDLEREKKELEEKTERLQDENSVLSGESKPVEAKVAHQFPHALEQKAERLKRTVKELETKLKTATESKDKELEELSKIIQDLRSQNEKLDLQVQAFQVLFGEKTEKQEVNTPEQEGQVVIQSNTFPVRGIGGGHRRRPAVDGVQGARLSKFAIAAVNAKVVDETLADQLLEELEKLRQENENLQKQLEELQAVDKTFVPQISGNEGMSEQVQEEGPKIYQKYYGKKKVRRQRQDKYLTKLPIKIECKQEIQRKKEKYQEKFAKYQEEYRKRLEKEYQVKLKKEQEKHEKKLEEQREETYQKNKTLSEELREKIEKQEGIILGNQKQLEEQEKVVEEQLKRNIVLSSELEVKKQELVAFREELRDELDRLRIEVSALHSARSESERVVPISSDVVQIVESRVERVERVEYVSLDDKYKKSMTYLQNLTSQQVGGEVAHQKLKILIGAAELIYDQHSEQEMQSLVESLEITCDYINGTDKTVNQITPEAYIDKAQRIREKPSKKQKILGGAMIAFGVVFMVAGLLGVLAGTGGLFATGGLALPLVAGICVLSGGLLIGGAALSFFGSRCFKDKMRDVSVSMQRFSDAKRDAKETGEILHTSFWRRKREWPKILKFQCPRLRRKLSLVPG